MKNSSEITNEYALSQGTVETVENIMNYFKDFGVDDRQLIYRTHEQLEQIKSILLKQQQQMEELQKTVQRFVTPQ
jgi:hypothetical protein